MKTRQPLDLAHHLQAVTKLKNRGPDHLVYQHRDTVFVAQTVLHITGQSQFYFTPKSDFLAFNGEIYNYRWFGSFFDNDTELVYRTTKDQNYRKFKHFEGPWAWVYTDFESVTYATDPQGERCLYHYQDSDILIVSSEISAILWYVNAELFVGEHTQKHWPVIDTTPYKNIFRCEPGRLYRNGQSCQVIDSIFDWCQDEISMSDQEAQQQFDHVFDAVMNQMQPTCDTALTLSGGVDTGVILSAMPYANQFYTTDCVGRDVVSMQAHEFLTQQQKLQHSVLSITAETWAREMVDIIAYTQMPVQSWSFVGQWHIAKHCSQRVLFTGIAADELFGGYTVYQNMQFNANTSVSPYSQFALGTASEGLWSRCIEAAQGHAGRATLLMDYLVQIGAVDARGVDSMTMAHGVEPRSPFMHPNIIKFALTLPWRLRQGKPLLRRRFLQHWSSNLLLNKQGFAGHCNDSLPWLNLDLMPNGNRDQQWKQIQQASFVKYCGTQTNQSFDQTKLV